MAYEPAEHGRSCLGLLLAGIVATLVFAAGFAMVAVGSEADLPSAVMVMSLFGAILGAAPATFLLGFPIYFLLRGRVRITLAVCLCVGAIIGLVTAAVWQMFPWPWLVWAATSGATGGLAFWWCAHKEIERDTVGDS
jgi:ABC-type xylose transport system permease subunit